MAVARKRAKELETALKIINELKEENYIDDYAIGGGIAALFYIEPFLTYDLDVFIIMPQKMEQEDLILLSPIYEQLERKGFSFKGEHIIIGGLPVQFIPADELEEEAVRNATSIEYRGIKTKVLTPEYLIAILLRAGRRKDRDKVGKIIEQMKIKKRELNAILIRYSLVAKFKKWSKD